MLTNQKWHSQFYIYYFPSSWYFILKIGSINKYAESYIACQLNCAPNKPFGDIYSKHSKEVSYFILNEPKLDSFPLQGLSTIKFGYCLKPQGQASTFTSKWEEGVSKEEKGKRNKSLGLRLWAIFFLADIPCSGKKNLQAYSLSTSQNISSKGNKTFSVSGTILVTWCKTFLKMARRYSQCIPYHFQISYHESHSWQRWASNWKCTMHGFSKYITLTVRLLIFPLTLWPLYEEGVLY